MFCENDGRHWRLIDDKVVDGIPEYIIAMFQGKFAIITPVLISGALAERVSMRGYIPFIVLWFLGVYCPPAHWLRSPRDKELASMDHALHGEHGYS